MSGLVGYHTSSAGGYFNAIKHAIDYDLETFQFFLGSPRTWNYREIKNNEPEKFKSKLSETKFNITTVHMKYLPNPSTPEEDKEMRKKTKDAFLEEIRRCDLLGVDNLVFHIGSHKGRGIETAKPMVADLINFGLEQDPQVNLLMETSAGSTNSVGSKFGEIADILELVDTSDKVGVCFDTCHVYAAGYDLRSKKAIDETLQEFDDIIGIDLLKVVHTNDSKGKLGVGRDRHANLGTGNIGKEPFNYLINHAMLDGLPFILETPGKNLKNDIKLLKEFISE